MCAIHPDSEWFPDSPSIETGRWLRGQTATLQRNAITLVSAFPDPDVDVLRLFPHRFSIEEGRRLVEVRVMEEGEHV